MDDNEWKMKITEDLATIRSDVAHILKSIPCEKIKSVDAKIKLNRGLIFLLFTLFVGLVSYAFQGM